MLTGRFRNFSPQPIGENPPALTSHTGLELRHRMLELES